MRRAYHCVCSVAKAGTKAETILLAYAISQGHGRSLSAEESTAFTLQEL